MSNDANALPTTVLDAVIDALDATSVDTFIPELIATAAAMLCGACEEQDEAFRLQVATMVARDLLGERATITLGAIQ